MPSFMHDLQYQVYNVLDKTNHDVMKVIGNLNFDRFFRDVLY